MFKYGQKRKWKCAKNGNKIVKHLEYQQNTLPLRLNKNIADKLASKIDQKRMKAPAFRMVLTGAGDFAYI